jgi:NAD(P)-dependent dehydrogenase (short-subunit alcohol dehydrogenase family)
LTSADERFRKGRIAVSGRAIKGTLDVFVRVPPVDQFSMRSIIGRVTPNEFTGMDALVIGGSRGLGALAARIIAAGGGHATITYLVGKAEADCNVEEIQEYGGRARSMAFDVREPPEPQLRGLETTPTHLFYFATCPILRSRKSIFSFHEFAALLQFYVQEFFNLCNCLLRFRSMKAATDRLIVFYPSTVFIEETPAGLLEYAMAKAAGEQLCAGMNKSLSGIFVVSRRLPKIKTDQTASMIPEQYADGMLTLLPIVRELWRLSRSQGQLLENLGGTADDV